MRILSAVAAIALMGAPACRAQAPRVVHHVTDSLTLVELGDTLLFIRGPSDSARRDAVAPDGKPMMMVALLKPESTFVVVGGKRTPMNPIVAKHVRNILAMAREEAAGFRPKPKQ